MPLYVQTAIYHNCAVISTGTRTLFDLTSNVSWIVYTPHVMRGERLRQSLFLASLTGYFRLSYVPAKGLQLFGRFPAATEPPVLVVHYFMPLFVQNDDLPQP